MGSSFFELVFLLGTYLFEFWLFRHYFQAFYTARELTRRYQYAMIAAISLFLTLLNGSVSDVTALMPVSQLVMFFVFVRICYSGNAQRLIFDMIIVFSASIAAELVGSFTILTLFPDPHTLFRPFDLLYVTATVLGKLVWYSVIRVIMANRKAITFSHYSKSSAALSVIPLIPVCLIVAIMLFAKEQADISLNAVLGLFLAMLIVIACIVVFRLYEASLERNELAHRLKRAQDETEYYNAVMQNESILRSRQHEYINSLATIKGMLETKADPVPYIGQIIADFGASQELAITADFSNKVINAILNNTKAICRENGIDLKINIEHYELAFLKPLDTGTLLNNAFNNAVEACTQLPDARGRRIWLRIYRLHDELVIGVKNTKANGVVIDSERVVSTKENADASVHGHGIANMRKTAAKYGGSVHFADEGAEFILTIRLKYPNRSL